MQSFDGKVSLQVFIDEENDYGDWDRLAEKGDRLAAVTAVDEEQPPEGDRLRVAETINFHPLWIKYQRERGFDTWTKDLFDRVTAKGALQEFQDIGKKKTPPVDIRPVDALFNASFIRNMLHEVGLKLPNRNIHDVFPVS
jgi:hypothetical protein